MLLLPYMGAAMIRALCMNGSRTVVLWCVISMNIQAKFINYWTVTQQRSQLIRGLHLNTLINLSKIDPNASGVGVVQKYIVSLMTNTPIASAEHFQRSLTCLAMHMVANVHAPFQFSKIRHILCDVRVNYIARSL